MNPQWYLLFTKPRQESLVVDQLHQRGCTVFAPTVLKHRRHGRKPLNEPLFPHYVFVHVDILSREAADLQWMPGVRGFVSFGQQPTVVPDSVMTKLQQQVEARDQGKPASLPLSYRQGQPVRVCRGPLAGLEAIFQRGINGTARVEVLMQFLGNLTRVRLDYNDIEEA